MERMSVVLYPPSPWRGTGDGKVTRGWPARTHESVRKADREGSVMRVAVAACLKVGNKCRLVVLQGKESHYHGIITKGSSGGEEKCRSRWRMGVEFGLLS